MATQNRPPLGGPTPNAQEASRPGVGAYRPVAPQPSWRELAEGESVAGVVLRLPAPGAKWGTRVLLDVDGRHVELYASVSRGHAVLARDLDRQHVAVGDTIRIRSYGWRETRDTERRYRLERVEVLARASAIGGSA